MNKKYIIVSILIIATLFFFNSKNEKLQEVEQIKFQNNQIKIVCFGDSITEGYGSDDGHTYPDYLRKELKVSIRNEGVTGDTTYDGIGRLDKVILHKPTHVILALGSNDYLQQIDLNKVKGNLSHIIKTLTDKNINVYLVKIYPKAGIKSFVDKESITKFEEIYRYLSKTYEIKIIDSAWENIWGHKEYFADWIHPNNKGYEIMAKNYAKILKKDLNLK